MAGNGGTVWADDFWAADFWANDFWEGAGGSAEPFGDVRYTAFGARVRRTAGLLVLFLALLGTG